MIVFCRFLFSIVYSKGGFSAFNINITMHLGHFIVISISK